MRSIPDDLRSHYLAMGWWSDESLGTILSRGLHEHADLGFHVHSKVRPYAGTLADVEMVARRLAAGLRARGVGPGDVIACQLPNWMEAAATFWASSILGAVVVPIVHFYGPKEVAFILADARPRVFVTAERHGRMTYDPAVSADVPIVGVVGSSFDGLLSDEPLEGVLDVDPGHAALIAYTSGTTSDPKGVVHTHQTLGFETRQQIANYQRDRGRQLNALPVGHFMGMLTAFLVPILEGTAVDLCDEWDPKVVIGLMDSDGVGFGGGPTYFVTSLLDHPDFRNDHLRYVSHIGLGGSTIPAAVTRRLTGLGITVTRAYGSTEHPSVTGTSGSAPEDKRLCTDGTPRTGVEIRLGDDGEVLSRGPDLCLGYTDEALTAGAFDDEGWYHTGDIGVIDADGYLSIIDRKSDMIIRGGENVSAAAVEEVLLTLPAVADAVVVSAPDPRLGERVAAVVRLRSGHPMPTMEDLRGHFRQSGVARQKWPEEIHEVEDFPRTASGKVQKHRVRELVARADQGWPIG
ncbi:AMP-binding protein [Gordonia hankookensis]|uniref:AMP-binding protein n=1 Tax=Gordonia hankookensis TaxID=589403 RepID=A0ABR7WA29_9ACTN|nr:AMP-binding protein [Gordonia hankookensis]MBD1319455.1 AMP-binding protein [Gordonia hankookensis]